MGDTRSEIIPAVRNAPEAAMPSHDGRTTSPTSADTFRILAGSKHPAAAFEFLKYLVGPASQELLSAYGAMPARTADQEAFFAEPAGQFTNKVDWQVVKRARAPAAAGRSGRLQRPVLDETGLHPGRGHDDDRRTSDPFRLFPARIRARHHEHRGGEMTPAAVLAVSRRGVAAASAGPGAGV
ncbi:hypothetical protein ACIBQ6_00780 [Nonomuraea sp. NPDC049655]|uniref:hypothetical protein n=1 Tax=Nonomuraea sp. NPDC049655 TaxID=3364355 RepID=UPI00378BA521